MKKTDIAMIVLIAGLSVLVSYLILNTLIQGGFTEQSYDVQTTQAITKEFEKPSSEIFNKEAINPTATTKIGGEGSSESQ